MHDLGVLCGLLPDMTPSSEQLNLVVDLISGMSQNEGKFLTNTSRRKHLLAMISPRKNTSHSFINNGVHMLSVRLNIVVANKFVSCIHVAILPCLFTGKKLKDQIKLI